MSYKDDKASPFGQPVSTSLSDVDQAIYGGVDAPNSGRMVARPVGLDEIRPDLKQPRRAIPQKIRGEWNGNPAWIRDLLMKWRIQVQAQTLDQIDVKALLIGEADFPDSYKDYAGVVGAYVELVRLAQNIRRDGLIAPISIYNEGGQKYILAGERRYLAHWMLWVELREDKWSKIPAQVVEYSVRQQVTENTARRDLNPVGLARCYAMMVMELYAEEEKTFKTFGEMVRPGQCDRSYYAQVAELPVPYGRSEEVMSAMSVKSRASISNYKSVLSVPDTTWTLADNEDWSMRQILDWLEAQKPQKPEISRGIVQRAEQFSEDNPQRLAPPSLRKDEGQSVRVDQWEDDEDYRVPPLHEAPTVDLREGEKTETVVVHETPPEMDGVTWLINDPEVIDLLEMWLKIYTRRQDERGINITKNLIAFSANNFADYEDITDLQVALTEVIEMFLQDMEELSERLVSQHEKISTEYEDLHGLG